MTVQVEWASLGSSPAPAGDSASRTSSNGEVLEVPLVPLPDARSIGIWGGEREVKKRNNSPGHVDVCSILDFWDCPTQKKNKVDSKTVHLFPLVGVPTSSRDLVRDLVLVALQSGSSAEKSVRVRVWRTVGGHPVPRSRDI